MIHQSSEPFPVLLESIHIDENLHVQRQYNGISHPRFPYLPPWFVNGFNAKLIKFIMLENFRNI